MLTSIIAVTPLAGCLFASPDLANLGESLGRVPRGIG
jgi:hypothetical protein